MPRTTRPIALPALMILLAAAVLRLALLSRIPPGLPFEEASLAGAALHPPTLLSAGPGSQIVTWLMAGSLALFGQNLLGVRMAAALCGLLTVVFSYRWAGLLYSKRVGLVAAGLVAVSFWPIYFSRIGLEAVTLPALVALASWLFVKGLKGSRPIWLGAAGVAAGAALYSPPGGWLVPAVFAVFYLVLAITQRDTLRAAPAGHIAFWAAAILIGLPLVITQAGVTITPQTSALAESMGKADFSPALDALGRAVGMWATLGDGLFHYNVGYWPVFNVGLATVFVIGLFYPVREAETVDRGGSGWLIARALVPGWLAAGVIGAALIDPQRPFTAGIIALPATYITLALGFELVGRLLGAAAARRWGWVLAVMVLLAGVEGAWSYFVVAPNDPLAQGDYRTDLFRLARDLRANPSGGAAAISTNPPDNLPPLIFDFLPHGERPLRWFDASTALIIPAAGAEIDIPDMVKAQPRLVAYLGQPSASVAGIRRYPVTPDQVLKNIPAAAEHDVVFGDILALLSHQSDQTRQAGKPLRVTLVYRVTRDAGGSLPDLAMFAHLLKPDGTLAAQSDLLGVASSGWRQGDLLIQTEDIPLPKKLTPGIYQLEIGLYERAGGKRLDVTQAGRSIGDRLLLEPVEITAP